jgi:hypothetical protein
MNQQSDSLFINDDDFKFIILLEQNKKMQEPGGKVGSEKSCL